jgi:hypothetical protein
MPTHYKTDGAQICLHCGETRAAIKKHKLFCATETNTEAGRETDQEWPKHRFKPWTAKELAAQKADEDEHVRQMGEFAAMVEREDALRKEGGQARLDEIEGWVKDHEVEWKHIVAMPMDKTVDQTFEKGVLTGRNEVLFALTTFLKELRERNK